MKTINLNNMKKYISTNDISFLVDFDRTIEINKQSKSKYFKMYRINKDLIKNFILNLDNDEIYMINPFITVNCKITDPVINLSRPFLVTNESNSALIHDYLFEQFKKAYSDFEMDMELQYYLIFKNKSIKFDVRIWE